MSFLKRLFGRRRTPVAEPLRGVAQETTKAEQGAMRQHMEEEVTADRERRGATDVRPGSERPPHENPDEGPTDHS